MTLLKTGANVLIEADELARLRDSGAHLVLLDARFDRERPDTTPTAETRRIPGAILVDLTTEVYGRPSRTAGARPLPDIADLEARARNWGINQHSVVVVYDDTSGTQAARLWWTLRWAGVTAARLLNGGLQAWRAAGLPTTTEPAHPPKGDIKLEPVASLALDADAAARIAKDGVLLDARGHAAYLGGPAQHGKAPTGHIPGAVSAPTTDHVGSDGRFKSTQDLRARFIALGVTPGVKVGVYCGSGNAAAHTAAALASIGIETALYVGSWSAWSADPARPVAIGAEPQPVPAAAAD